MFAPFSMAAEATAIVDSHVRCLLGGASAKAWIADAPVSTHGAFRVVGPVGRSTPVRLGNIESAGEACEGTRTAAVHPAPPEGKPYVVMSGDWNPQPRPVEDIFSNKNRYSAAIRQFLATRGIEEQGEIRQILQADLDGDGNAEVIAVVRNPDSFAAVLVRRQEKGRVQTLIADLETSEDDLSEHNIAMIADLNGDGMMEIVVYGEYKQGVFTAVYTLEGGGVRKVLSCACGG
jgi:hypothetical protein